MINPSFEVVRTDDLHGADLVTRQPCHRCVFADRVLAGSVVEAVGHEAIGGLDGMRLLPHDRVGETLSCTSFRLRPTGGELLGGDMPEIPFDQVALHVLFPSLFG